MTDIARIHRCIRAGSAAGRLRTGHGCNGFRYYLEATSEPEDRRCQYVVRGGFKVKLFAAAHIDDASFVFDTLVDREEGITLTAALAACRYALSKCSSLSLSGTSGGRPYREWYAAAHLLYRKHLDAAQAATLNH